VLLPVYAAFCAAIVFYLLIPILGAFMLRSQWRRFRERVLRLELAPSLRYRHLARALDEGKAEVGRFRLRGTIDAIEGTDKLWVRGKEASALVDLSCAPLFVLAPAEESAGTEAGSIERLKWNSVSSLVEGTSVFVAGLLIIEEGRPIFIDRPDEALIAVCHEDDEKKLTSRLIAGGRAPNEYWNYPTRISLALGLVAISSILLAYGSSPFSTVRSLIFLIGAGPVLPFAPPGLVFFFVYRGLWRTALASRTARDLLRLPLRLSGKGAGGGGYERRTLGPGEAPPEEATRIPLRSSAKSLKRRRSQAATLFVPFETGEPEEESFIVEGEPEAQAQRAEREAFFYAAAAGLAFGLAIVVNFIVAFLAWRAALK
jgi:hypothetical protein